MTDFRIVLAISTMDTGGAQRVISGLADHCVEAGHTVLLLTMSGEKPDRFPTQTKVLRTKLDLLRQSKNPVDALTSFFRRHHLLRKEISEFKPNVVISFIDRMNVRVLFSLIGTRTPVVVSERIDPREYSIGGRWEIARRLLYRRAMAVVVQTQSVARWASSFVKQDRVRVIPNGISDLPVASSLLSRQNKIVGIGRIVPQKGFDILLTAFCDSKAAERGWVLEILGEGEELEKLKEQAVRLGLESQVAFLGRVTNPWDYLNTAKIFVLSSRFEGFPNALLEAMGMGCACIATDCRSGPSDLIVDGQNGLLVETQSITAIREAIDLLVQDIEKARSLGERATEVRQTYDNETIAQLWEDIIEDVVLRRL